ncbi:flagellar hook-associated protein 2 [Onishia taeanensis]|uniref:Flagellar hook-associated protein 2 n=1 Tax=Onishia taeanensis TaxID=284577 RepID=A0A1G7REK0_9GAMM|nr:flagellar filament capping protein FliD [Halomonas taeanensis]SDG08470.1 flagellar hook-associated protein 2 [Halomonas taeanensis]
MATISSLGIGSGLDLNGLLDQLKSAEREQLKPITQQQKSYQSQISAYGQLESALSKFQDAAAKLNDADLFKGVTSEVTGSAVTAAGGTDAAPGRYDIEVTQLARAQSLAADGVDDSSRSLGSAGTLTLGIGSGAGTDIEIAAGSSLEDVRDSINAAGVGVQASIVNDGGAGGAGQPYRLVLTSEETGTESEIAVSFDDGDGGTTSELEGLMGNTSALTETVSAANAELSVNGIDITSQSNTVEGAVQGVTLSVAEVDTATLTVKRDNASVESAVSSFVSSYNQLQSKMADLTSFNAETGQAGELLGDGTLRSVESRLRNALGGNAAESGTIQMLSDIGVSLKVDGKLELDEEALRDVVADDLGALSTFFTGDDEAGGFAGQVDAVLERMLSDNGLIANSTQGLEDSVDRLGERYSRTEESIANTIARYREQFSQLDSMIANMNSTSSYLTQQFSNMNAQLGRN